MRDLIPGWQLQQGHPVKGGGVGRERVRGPHRQVHPCPVSLLPAIAPKLTLLHSIRVRMRMHHIAAHTPKGQAAVHCRLCTIAAAAAATAGEFCTALAYSRLRTQAMLHPRRPAHERKRAHIACTHYGPCSTARTAALAVLLPPPLSYFPRSNSHCSCVYGLWHMLAATTVGPLEHATCAVGVAASGWGVDVPREGAGRGRSPTQQRLHNTKALAYVCVCVRDAV
eukprot:scaffold31570_cov17-Tisochrysis_lutea.AAC.1